MQTGARSDSHVNSQLVCSCAGSFVCVCETFGLMC